MKKIFMMAMFVAGFLTHQISIASASDEPAAADDDKTIAKKWVKKTIKLITICTDDPYYKASNLDILKNYKKNPGPAFDLFMQYYQRDQKKSDKLRPAKIREAILKEDFDTSPKASGDEKAQLCAASVSTTPGSSSAAGAPPAGAALDPLKAAHNWIAETTKKIVKENDPKKMATLKDFRNKSALFMLFMSYYTKDKANSAINSTPEMKAVTPANIKTDLERNAPLQSLDIQEETTGSSSSSSGSTQTH